MTHRANLPEPPCTARLETTELADWADPADLAGGERPPVVETVWVWGLPLARVDSRGLLDLVDDLIRRRRPSFFITANLHWARLCHRDGRLREVNRQAAFLVADGMPLVWWSRLAGRGLPERVTGADSVYRLCGRAAEVGHRVFLLGGAPEVARQAAENLRRLCPGLNLVGVESPILSDLTPQEHDGLLERIRRARPDLLFVALGQPKGELWLAEHVASLGVPACVQIGAAVDFVAGRVSRAPRWLQRIGCEWLYRVRQEPRRMIPRYARDGLFLVQAVAGDLRTLLPRTRKRQQL